MPDEKTYWFPAKRLGWGWGFPQVWQGWLVLGLAVVTAVGAGLLYPPARYPVGFFLVELGVVLAIIVVCMIKGEPPRWHWGGD